MKKRKPVDQVRFETALKLQFVHSRNFQTSPIFGVVSDEQKILDAKYNAIQLARIKTETSAPEYIERRIQEAVAEGLVLPSMPGSALTDEAGVRRVCLSQFMGHP